MKILLRPPDMYKNTHWEKMNQHERVGACAWDKKELCLDTTEKLIRRASAGLKEGTSPATALVLCSPSTAIREDIYSPQQFSSSLPLGSRIEIQILLASTFARHEILLGKMFSYPSRNNKGMCSLQTSNRSNSLNTAVAFSFIHCAIPVPNLGLGHLFFQE